MPAIKRSTKIVATLGPASTSKDVLTRTIPAGVDDFRMNFSNGTPDEHPRRASRVRQAAQPEWEELVRASSLRAVLALHRSSPFAAFYPCDERSRQNA